ncbi:mitochondrial ribosomal death-associated protein 3-domain-containing protein [Phellopilus nigrolimitatus]|nr:mitochondrial ribosomal death-associated protein 3-domain-containing protein [Phellopilus nigrolimitatus]
MKTFGLPRNMLVDFRMLSMPCAVSRKSTQALVERLDAARRGPSLDNRLVLTGSAGCGKSYLMLQLVSYSAVNDWIVLYIPRAHKLVDSSTSYFYDPRTQTYLQPTASNQILQRFLTVNKKILEKLKVSGRVTFEKRKAVDTGKSLADLINIAMSEQHLAPVIMSKVLEEIGKQERYPVLLAVDEFQALYGKTEYRNQHYEHIKSFHLSVPRLLMEYACGKKHFKRGAVIGALSSSLSQYPITRELQQALQRSAEDSERGQISDPYTKVIAGMVEYSQGLSPFEVPGKLEYAEAAALFEIWMRDKALHSAANDELFLSKYSESSGNARAFVHGGLLATQLS